MELHLTRKVVLVSGSSKGIGFGIARAFLKEGAAVVLNGRDLPTLQQAQQTLQSEFKDASLLVLNQDLSLEHEVTAALLKIEQQFGRLDCVVANIGSGKEPMGLALNADVLQKSFEVNVVSTALLLQQSIPYLKKSAGNFIAIGSIAGMEALNAPIAYSMGKAALPLLIKKAAKELGPSHIRVNLIAPGNIYFQGGTWDRKLQQDSVATKAYIAQHVPLNAFGDVEDIANAALFLASPLAKFITGSVLVVDGGQTHSF